MKRVRCPQCRGSGRNFEVKSYKPTRILREVPCPMCEGKGKIKLAETEKEQSQLEGGKV